MIQTNKYLYYITFLFGLLFLLSIVSCVRNTNFPVNKKVICDAEQRTVIGDKFIATNDSTEFFDGGWFRSSIDAHSGKHSALTIPKTKAFAMGYKIKHAGADAYFNVSVWRKSKDGKGTLVVAGNNTEILYLVTSKPVETAEGGWEKLELEAYTPPHFGNGVLSIYVWNNGTDTVYYDDLTIERSATKSYPEYNYDEGLNIVLDTTDFMKVMGKRKQAFETGILQTSDDDWIKSILVDNDVAKKAKVRLKGDWLDHLWGDKWSYRIKMRKDNTFKRMRTFSLQTPSARSFLIEWLTHKLYHENDILTTRYGFIPIKFNNQPRGLYAWEEHFVKQLPEWNNRREGPIVKFSEDPFWQIQKININHKKWPNFPFYQAATIIPFQQSRIIETPVLYGHFLNAQRLMHQYKNQLKLTSEIFDLNKLAAYYAMLELTHARHGMVWHNQRMYYNPVICKLEPIAFDGYTDHDNPDLTINDNMAYRTLTQENPVILQDYLIFNLFVDTVFLNRYMQYLEKFTDHDFVTGFMDSSNPQALYYDSLLRMEFPIYPYNKNLLVESATAIREYLPELKNIIQDSLYEKKFTFNLKHDIYSDSSVYEDTPEFFVNAYSELEFDDSIKLDVYNYFPRELVLLGTGEDNKLITSFFIEKYTLPTYSEGMTGEKLTLNVDSSANYIFFMTKENMDTYSVPILSWPFPSGSTPQQELWDKVDLNNEFFESISGNNIYVKEGDFTINEPIIIPGGYKVNFSEGTIINLVNRAMIISYSPVFMTGTKNKPIIITSSDFTGNGFTVLQADGESIVDNVIIENLNTLNYHGWTLTGALTFYESDVTITNTKFYRNQCEDALNIIRSEFTVSNSSFDYIFGDAFDADFCTGKVLSSTFNNIGNDAMDFSGSDIEIADSKVTGAEDKGVSGGEDSKVRVINTTIQNANIGFASKDLSVVEVIDSKAITCNYGIVLLQKKPEYGPSLMILNNTQLLQSKVEMLIEENSTVNNNGLVIPGKEKNLGEIFY